MNSGRESGLYEPSFTASMLGPTPVPFGLMIGTARILSL
jgi:hypothetical protein